MVELAEQLGDEVLQVASQVDVDYQGLIRWHLIRMIELIEQLQKKFGPEVIDIILAKERAERINNGIEMAEQSVKNTIEDIIPYFGGNQNVIERSEQHCLIHTKYCALANAAKDAGIEELIYQLHCCSDPFFVEGFNNELKCEVRKSLLHGDDYCEHYIYKDNKCDY